MILLNYILPAAAVVLALIYFAKDWKDLRKSWRRLVVLGLIILIEIGGIFNTHYTNKKIDRQHDEDQKRIAGLKEAVETANKNQKDNTTQFTNAFGKLSQKVSNLQSQVKTVGLREEADKLKAELASTQKALNPPKAILALTFAVPNHDGTPLRRITLPVKNDVVHVEFFIMNTTLISAQKPEFMIQICEV
jgi:hypothetical protein